MLNVAIIGFGGIAKAAHLNPYLQLQKDGFVKLVAVCDVCSEQFTEKAEINIGESDSGLSEEVNKYTDYKEMLQKESVDMVDICLPTFLHAEATIYALNAGCHVLCEKPMSLNYDLCSAMVDAANKNGKKLMIGQCLRFFNIYNFLKEMSIWNGSTDTHETRDYRYFSQFELDCADKGFLKSRTFKKICQHHNVKFVIIDNGDDDNQIIRAFWDQMQRR